VPPPNVIVNYLGQETFQGVVYNAWQGADPTSEVFFTDVNTNAFVGGRTADSSQLATFSYMQAVPLAERVFAAPPNVTCTPTSASALPRHHATHLHNAFLLF
jgi:hypothetical protein